MYTNSPFFLQAGENNFFNLPIRGKRENRNAKIDFLAHVNFVI